MLADGSARTARPIVPAGRPVRDGVVVGERLAVAARPSSRPASAGRGRARRGARSARRGGVRGSRSASSSARSSSNSDVPGVLEQRREAPAIAHGRVGGVGAQPLAGKLDRFGERLRRAAVVGAVELGGRDLRAVATVARPRSAETSSMPSRGSSVTDGRAAVASLRTSSGPSLRPGVTCRRLPAARRRRLERPSRRNVCHISRGCPVHGDMNIAIVGGTGTVGAETARELSARGHDVRVLSRHAPEYPVDLRDRQRAGAGAGRRRGGRRCLPGRARRARRGHARGCWRPSSRRACGTMSASRSSASTASAGATTGPSSTRRRRSSRSRRPVDDRARDAVPHARGRTFAASAGWGCCRRCACRCSRSIRARSGGRWRTRRRPSRRWRSRSSPGRRC